MGANNVNQNSDYDSIRTANCTSAPFQNVDLSVYWAVSVIFLCCRSWSSVSP